MDKPPFDPAVGGFPRPSGTNITTINCNSSTNTTAMPGKRESDNGTRKDNDVDVPDQQHRANAKVMAIAASTNSSSTPTSVSSSSSSSTSSALNAASDPFISHPASSSSTITATTADTALTATNSSSMLSPTAPGFVPSTSSMGRTAGFGAAAPSAASVQLDKDLSMANDMKRFSLFSTSDKIQFPPAPSWSTPSTSITTQGSSQGRVMVQGQHFNDSNINSSMQMIHADAKPWLHASLGDIDLSDIPFTNNDDGDDGDEEDDRFGVPASTTFSRAFMIENVPVGISYLSLAALFDRKEFPSLNPPILDSLPTHGTIYLSFSDLRDARAATCKIRRCQPGWLVRPLPAYAENGRLFISLYRGQKRERENGVVECETGFEREKGKVEKKREEDTRMLSHAVKDIVERVGAVRGFRTLAANTTTIGGVNTTLQQRSLQRTAVAEFVVEFWDVRCAERCVRCVNGMGVDDCYLEVKHYRPDHSLDCEGATSLYQAPGDQQQHPSQQFPSPPLSTSAPSDLSTIMYLPPSLGIGFRGSGGNGNRVPISQPPPLPPAGRAQQTGVGLGLTLGATSTPRANVTATTAASALPWQRGHHAQQNSNGSSSSGTSGGTRLTSANTTLSFRRLSTGSAFSVNCGNPASTTNGNANASGNGNDSGDCNTIGGTGMSLPAANFTATAGSNGLAIGQLVKLSPTGRTTIPITEDGASGDAWYGGSPTRLNDHQRIASAFGMGVGLGIDANDASNGGCSISGDPTSKILPFDRRDEVSATPASTSLSAWGNSCRDPILTSMSLAPASSNNCGAPLPQSQGPIPSGNGTSIHIPNSTLSMMRYRENMSMMGMNMNGNNGCNGQCQHNQAQQQVVGHSTHQHGYHRHDHHSGHSSATTCLGSNGNGRMAGHHRPGSNNNSNNQNHVDIEKIKRGQDVRTTIMLRNIPNKIDQMMLKEIVDETSFGKYDFMYLRIDFANNCNVGYAFINFEDPIDIIDFANARAGKTWNCFNSDKVAEISYATIQGKDCLVQKFRNSSVMLEHPSFRPKIFHTGTGPLASTEDVFPPPDNPSKMRRSVENAEHVGLFAPRVGQQFRDEQRRRRSQFDRGTTAAEREIYPLTNSNPPNMSTNMNVNMSANMNMSAMSMNNTGTSTSTTNTGPASSGNNSSCPWTPQSHHGPHGSSTGPSSTSSAMTAFSPHRRTNAINNGGGMASIAEMQVGIGNGSPTFFGTSGDTSGLSMSPTLMSPSAKALGAGNVSGTGLGNGSSGLPSMWGERW